LLWLGYLAWSCSPTILFDQYYFSTKFCNLILPKFEDYTFVFFTIIHIGNYLIVYTNIVNPKICILKNIITLLSQIYIWNLAFMTAIIQCFASYEFLYTIHDMHTTSVLCTMSDIIYGCKPIHISTPISLPHHWSLHQSEWLRDRNESSF
jgi:hypothetical protein